MKPNIKYIILLIVIVVFAVSFFVWKNDTKDLVRYSKFGKGVITGINPSSRSGTFCDYTFELNGQKYSGSSKVFMGTARSEKLIGRTFAVIYDSTDVSNNEILITKKQFERYNLSYPDSLNWIEN